MKLSALASAYQRQLEKEYEFSSLSFQERMALLVDAEYDSRHNTAILNLLKKAHFNNSSAFIENIDYFPDRHLNRDQFLSLRSNAYIQQALNVILIGATGSGKTFISNALGVNACQSGYATRYIRLPELFSEFESARIQGKYNKVMKKFQLYSLLILDEFLLVSITETEQRDILELMEYRNGNVSTIVCSQFTVEGWHERLGGGAIADSILDRLIPSSYIITIDGEISMRKRKAPFNI